MGSLSISFPLSQGSHGHVWVIDCGEEDIVLREGVEGTGSRMSAWSSGTGCSLWTVIHYLPEVIALLWSLLR